MRDDFSIDRDEQAAELPSRRASLLERFAIAHLFVVLPGLCLGVTAFHIWTTYLFFKNWGAFGAIVAFCMPGVSELVAVVACSWWGVWFYVLAAATS